VISAALWVLWLGNYVLLQFSVSCKEPEEDGFGPTEITKKSNGGKGSEKYKDKDGNAGMVESSPSTE